MTRDCVGWGHTQVRILHRSPFLPLLALQLRSSLEGKSAGEDSLRNLFPLFAVADIAVRPSVRLSITAFCVRASLGRASRSVHALEEE